MNECHPYEVTFSEIWHPTLSLVMPLQGPNASRVPANISLLHRITPIIPHKKCNLPSNYSILSIVLLFPHVYFSLHVFRCARHEGVWETDSTAALIHNPGTRWGEGSASRPGHFTICSSTHWITGWVGFSVETNLMSLLRIEKRSYVFR
jgi:hypothetical protein